MPMLHLRGRKSRDWHEKIRKTVARVHSQPFLQSGSPNLDFPWSQLRLHTDNYLQKKGKILPVECDKRLKDFIQSHGAILTAVGACAHRMSSGALDAFMIDRLASAQLESRDTEPFLSPNQTDFLKIIILAHQANPLIIKKSDSLLAQALVQCFSSAISSTGERLAIVIKLLKADRPSPSFAFPFVYMMLQGYSAKLSAEVEILKGTSSWLKAHSETKYLSTLLIDLIMASAEEMMAVEILSAQFPEWKIWAEWCDSDSQLTQALEQPVFVRESEHLSGFSDTIPASGTSLEKLIKIQTAGISRKTSFVYLEALKQTRILSTELSLKVQALRSLHQWLMAHEETKWLSVLLNPPLQSSMELSEVVEILDAQFPDWRDWAAWQNSDTVLAVNLIPCCTKNSGSVSKRLDVVAGLFKSAFSTRSLLLFDVKHLVRSLAIELGGVLVDLLETRQWLKALEESQRLTYRLDQIDELFNEEIKYADAFDLKYGPNFWKAWALWRPDMKHLHSQATLEHEKRTALCDLFALEGPDMISYSRGSLREALSSSTASTFILGSTCIIVKDPVAGGIGLIIERISRVVMDACTGKKPVVDLLIHLCGRGKIIDERTLDILEGDNALRGVNLGDSVITQLILLVLSDNPKQEAAVKRLLPLLDHPQGRQLCVALSSHILEIVLNLIRSRKSAISIRLKESVWRKSILVDIWSLHTLCLAVQATRWLHPMLDKDLVTLVSRWPSNEELETLIALFTDIPDDYAKLRKDFDQYFIERIIKPDTIDADTRRLIYVLMDLWSQKPDPEKKLLALSLGMGPGFGALSICECIRQLPRLPDELVLKYNQISKKLPKDPNGYCISIAKLTVSESGFLYGVSTCWHSVACTWIKQQETHLLNYALIHLTAEEWFEWLSILEVMFPETLLGCVQNPELHQWAHDTISFQKTITLLERVIGSGPATQCLLVGFKCIHSERIMEILRLLEGYFKDSEDGQTLQPAVRATITLLHGDSGGNVLQICLALAKLGRISAEGNSTYLRVLEIFQNASRKAAHVILVGYYQHPDLGHQDRSALEALGQVFDIKADNQDCSTMNALDDTSHYITGQVASIVTEIGSLAKLRRSLKAMDPEGTSALLEELGIEDTSPLEDEIADLSPEFVNVIEMVGKHDVELHFPLTQLSDLQRIGMGLKKSQSLVIRLFVASPSLPSGFCLHFDDEPKHLSSSHDHAPWLALDIDSSDGGTSNCYGYVNRATFQLGIILARHLKDGPKPLDETYRFLKAKIDDLSQFCMVCGTSLGIRLRRSTVCQNASCTSTFLIEAAIDIQIPDVRIDKQVADLLLTATQAAAASGNMALLPEFPFGDVGTVKKLLNAMTTEFFTDPQEFWYRHVAKTSLTLLKWIFCHYDGFLVSTSGQMRIPSMPGVHQFLLANAAPGLETAFAAQVGSLPTRVVFHGTSLDRLYAILLEGLQICSGNPSLQRHGAAHGHGIYVAAEPATAMIYAQAYTPTVSGGGWRSKTFNNFSVLLACETPEHIYAKFSRGVGVITDPAMLILRREDTSKKCDTTAAD